MLIVLVVFPVLTDSVGDVRFRRIACHPSSNESRSLAAALSMLLLLTLAMIAAVPRGNDDTYGGATSWAGSARVMCRPGRGADAVYRMVAAERSISAILVARAQNLNDPDVAVTLIVGALLLMVALVITGGEIGKRRRPK